MDRLARRLDAPLALLARGLMAVLFVMAGLDAAMDFENFGQRMAAEGLPYALSGLVFWFLILAGLGLVLGIQARVLGLAMAGFSLASGLMDYADFQHATDMVMLLKNIALTGGFLFVTLHGAGAWSIDGVMERRRRGTFR